VNNTQTATRLLCFALIAAIESDLRDAIRHVAEPGPLTEIFPDDVRSRAERRWLDDHKGTALDIPEADLDLLGYTDFGDIAKLLHGLSQLFLRSGTQRIANIASGLESLVGTRNRVCHSRPLEPDDFASLHDFAEDLQRHHRSIDWQELSKTLRLLRDNSSALLNLQIPQFWLVDQPAVQHNLPMPEFDDTGFLGRVNDRREVKKLLLGPHPVISIVGEGGVGKTALTLRCLYDLLDSPEGLPFDWIVWFSLKTKVLTAAGAREIQAAIVSNVGLVRAVAGELGTLTQDVADFGTVIDEIRLYLAEFRILLLIDNLETITWQSLRPLLSQVPLGSKVCITSRVGLGEIELRYALEPLDPATAVNLMRRYAKTFNLRSVAEAKEQMLKGFCALLYQSPLLIKWFVASVASGAQPKSLVDRGTRSFVEVLRFCFENLFNRLSVVEREIIHILAAARRPLSQPELYLMTSHLNRVDVEAALTTLYHSSMLRRSLERKPAGSLSGMDYDLTEIARDYVAKCAPPGPGLFERVRSQLQDVRAFVESESVQRAAYKYDILAIHANTRDERIAGMYLRRALTHAKDGQLDDARRQAEEAKSSLPGYSETYRILALIEAQGGNTFRAAEEYEAATRVDPTSTIVRYSYAQFLVDYLTDFEGALAQISEALLRDGEDPTLLTYRAAILGRLGRFEESAVLYERLLSSLDGRALRWRLATRDQAAECYRKWADREWRMSDYASAVRHIGRGLEILGVAFESDEIDALLIRRLSRVADDGMRFSGVRNDIDFARHVVGSLVKHKGRYGKWKLRLMQIAAFRATFSMQPDIETALDSLPILTPPSGVAGDAVEREGPAAATRSGQTGDGEIQRLGEEAINLGRVEEVVQDRGFGYIRDDSGGRWFFHRNQVKGKDVWGQLRIGARVEFRVGRNPRGPCAIEVTIK
jgi:LuxR family glucitol operon transcriptional activator